MEDIRLIRETRSVCSICCTEIPARIIRKNGRIIMEKNCPQHGDLSFILSSNANCFEELSEAHFTILPTGMPLKILELSMTPRCEMNCPICSVMRSIGSRSHDLTTEDVKRIISEHPDKEITLWGMEPTENEQLEDILRLLKANKKQPFLFTNGKKLEVFSYLKRLKDAGLAHVYLQFDGFDDEVYKALRNKSLIKNKLAVLENLKKLKIPTTFNVTLAKGVNEHQIRKIIDYSIENSDFVRQIGFLPLIRVGGADNYREEIVPECHEFLKIIERKTKGRINLNNLRAFQKLMYVVYRFTKFRRCFWFTLFILVKEKNGKGYRTIDELIDMKAAESAVDEYIKTLKLKNKPSLFANLKLLFKLIVHILNFNTLPLCFSGLKFLLFGRRLEDARSDRGLIFITCTDFCDLYKMDLDMADNFCEELLAVKDKTGNIVYKPTYRMMIEGSKDN